MFPIRFGKSPQLLMGLGLAACLLLTACGPRRAGPVQVDVARETLIQVLDHWKQGGDINELRQAEPEIVAQEPLWTNGGKLLDYSLAAEGNKEDANWYCEVELTLQLSGTDKPTTKTVTYVVGTDPVLTVFHAIL